jgi:hypothetical protein
MPKGKAKGRNPQLYQGTPEPSETMMARQGASHRRGGTHKVRDENKTDSVYDLYNYKELVDTAKERSIYRKDMKKVEMAWALKRDDENRKRAERDAVIARQRRLAEAKKDEERRAAEKQEQLIQKHRKRMEKEERRERDASISDDTLSDADMEAEEDTRDEYKRETFGQALSDESWDSTSSESSAGTVEQSFEPDCRLRLFEWPDEKMPSLTPVKAKFFSWIIDPLPCPVPYAPLKITTIHSKQKLMLPGAKYPPGVDTDFAPVLNSLTRSAARNGLLLGPLRKATIEKGTDWAQRTLVQGWNAHMYLHLGSRNETKALADTYHKWHLESRKLLRVKGKGNGDPSDRAARHAQRQKNKARKTAEVYEASQYRPVAMCYVPAYLDYGEPRHDEVKNKSLENLFFIKFPGCDVPHYYFWIRDGEWSNPAQRNPTWKPAESKKMSVVEAKGEGDEHQGRRRRKPAKTQWMRIRKASSIHSSPPPSLSPMNVKEAITLIEQQLYTDGLSVTLAHYRQKWLANGKHSAWRTFAAALPKLWPSGEIPSVPPVRSKPGFKVAVKLATVDMLKEGGETPFSPLNGNEGWTRDDDRAWEVVEVTVDDSSASLTTPCENDGVYEEQEHNRDNKGDEEQNTNSVTGGDNDDADDEALYRRGSMSSPQSESNLDPVIAWLDQVNPVYSLPLTLMQGPKREMDIGEWEEKYLRGPEHASDKTCPFCCMQWSGMAGDVSRDRLVHEETEVLTKTQRQAEHMLSHSLVRPVRNGPASVLIP